VSAGVAFAAVAAFEKGTDYVPHTGLAMIHQSEAVATRGENSQISKLIAWLAERIDQERSFTTMPTSAASTAPAWLACIAGTRRLQPER
jgi:hypothetical protein